MAEIKDMTALNTEIQQEKAEVTTNDFSMITFSLAGKDYAVDIMNVKEIAKADKFTFVPNTASFVRGVYNLRGDIIPIVDMRIFFHLPAEKKRDGIENMLILHIEDKLYGAIVDKIDRVVGINSETIQPPHPIFGDINIKFIKGIVENGGDLYILLDVLRIFSQNEEDKDAQAPEAQSASAAARPFAAEESAAKLKAPVSTENLQFVSEGLQTLKHFTTGPLNQTWLSKRFQDWASSHSEDQLQFKDAGMADQFLQTFYSPCTGHFWDEDYAAAVKDSLPDMPSNSVQVWEIGCGKGYESYSLACILKVRYPNAHIKIWANDSDILAISGAPNMAFDESELPGYCKNFVVKGKNGFSFNKEIKDSILFEYHDVTNDNNLPPIDIILARDILSFLPVDKQNKMFKDFAEKLKPKGLIIMGENEQLVGNEGGVEWRSVGKDTVSAFMHNEGETN
jgi:purine-binding chemotaxis protein CheW